jgi:hypothetical protein
VRLATSARLAIAEQRLAIDEATAAAAILDGYRAALEAGGRPFVLAEGQPTLRAMAVHRLHIAGLGSLGRQRYVALAEWEGGFVAREAKALAPSACLWASGGRGSARILYQDILDRAVRCRDPFVRLQRRWIVRRLAPDCSRIELAALPKVRDELRLLRAMGWETANVHLGSVQPRVLRNDLARRSQSWLRRAAAVMQEAVAEDWEAWRLSARSA